MRASTVSVRLLALLLTVIMAHPVDLRAADEYAAPSFSGSEDSYSNFAPVESPAAASVASERSSANSRITLELKGVNILDVLKILSKRSNLNIVAGRDVRGDVTLYLQNVEVRKALDTIVQTLGLAYDEKDSILTVMTSKEYEARYGKPFRDERVTKTFKFKYAGSQVVNQMLQQLKSTGGKIAVDERTNTFIVTDLPEVISEIENTMLMFDVPLVTRVFTLQYAKAADLEESLNDYLTPQIGLLKIDKRSNQISVTDREENVNQIEDIVRAFDVRPAQVLIEAKVVEVQLYDAFRFGVDWGYVAAKLGDAKTLSLAPAFAVSAPTASTLGAGTLSALTLGEGTGTSDSDRLSLVVNILQNIGKTNILSSPRLLVLNNEEAKLAVATREPFVSQTVSQSQSTSTTADQVQFVDVGVTLTVVPTISHDRNVVLKVKPEVSTSGTPLELQGVASGSNTSFVRTRVPVVTTQTLETTVVVRDGATVVIGGLMQDQQSKAGKKLPILGDIPILGVPFRTKSNNFRKTELVIFLTPHIIAGQANSMERSRYLTPDSDLIDFDEVGGYDYLKAQSTTTQGPLRLDDKAFWQSPVKEKPVYVATQDMNIKTSMLRQGTNETMERLPSGEEVLPASQRAREYYRSMIHAAISDELNHRKSFKKARGQFEVFLGIAKTGKVRLVQFASNSSLSAREKQAVVEAIRSISPFPAFAQEMNSDEELFDLKFAVS